MQKVYGLRKRNNILFCIFNIVYYRNCRKNNITSITYIYTAIMSGVGYFFLTGGNAYIMENKRYIIVLGIETSCDETSVAVVKNGREVLSNVINSQIKIHEEYGGVVPEIASRNHVQNINMVVKKH